MLQFKWKLVVIIVILCALLILPITQNEVALSKLHDTEKWIREHTFKVRYVVYYKYDKKQNILYISVKFITLSGPKRDLLNLDITKREYFINVTKYGGLDKLNEKLPRKLKLNNNELKTVKEIGIIVKSLGNGTEVLTTRDDPPDSSLPLYTYSYDALHGIFVAADPINIVFGIYSPSSPPISLDELYSKILLELRDNNQVDDEGTDDDWPPPTIALDQYIYDPGRGDWVKQDWQIVEGDSPVLGVEKEDWDRIHFRLWKYFSSEYGYVIVGNVHMETAGFPEHEILHIDNDYTYGYEYAEQALAEEFIGSNGARWWIWYGEGATEPLKVYSYKPSSGEDITSYYVFVEYEWSVGLIALGNNVLNERILGDGYATYICYIQE